MSGFRRDDLEQEYLNLFFHFVIYFLFIFLACRPQKRFSRTTSVTCTWRTALCVACRYVSAVVWTVDPHALYRLDSDSLRERAFEYSPGDVETQLAPLCTRTLGNVVDKISIGDGSLTTRVILPGCSLHWLQAVAVSGMRMKRTARKAKRSICHNKFT